MACPHCGDHLLHKHAGQLRCCRCDRIRHDLAPSQPLQGMGRHLPILVMGLLVLPVVFGMASLDAGRSAGGLGAAISEPGPD
ncbi:MAG: hypothetical protein ACKO0M_10760 [Cyanobium sp.]